MMKRLFSSQLRINMISGTVTTAVNIAVLAIGYPIYLHFLGYERYGVWLVLTTVLTFARLGNLGVDRAVMKLVAEEHGRGDVIAIERYLVAALSILCFAGGLTLVLILAFKIRIVALFGLDGQNREVALSLLPYVGCLSVYVFVVQAVNAAVSGLGRMDLANYMQTAGRVVKVSVAGILLHSGRGIESLLIASTLSYVTIHVFSIIAMRRMVCLRLLRLRNFEPGCYRKLLGFGSGVLGGSVLNMLLNPFNKLIVSRFVGVASIPVYEIAFQGSMHIRGLVEVGLRALMPEVSRIGAVRTESARRRIREMNRKSILLVFLIGASLYLLFALFTRPILHAWLGQRYVGSMPGVFRLLLAASFLSLLGVPSFFTVMGLGRSRCIFFAYLVQSAINVFVVVGMLVVGMPISVSMVACSVLLSMGAATVYLFYEKQRVLSCDGWQLGFPDVQCSAN